MTGTDDDLKRRFDALRHADASRVPLFERTVSAPPRRAPAWLAPVAAALAVAIGAGAWFARRGAEPALPPAAEISTGLALEMPTDFLLVIPSRDPAREPPRLRASPSDEVPFL